MTEREAQSQRPKESSSGSGTSEAVRRDLYEYLNSLRPIDPSKVPSRSRAVGAKSLGRKSRRNPRAK